MRKPLKRGQSGSVSDNSSRESAQSAALSPDSAAPRRRPSRRGPVAAFLAGAASAALLAGAVVTAQSALKSESPRVFKGKPGPWGQLGYTRIAIEPPEEYLTLDPASGNSPDRWFFKEWTRPETVALFKSAGLTAEELEKVLNKAVWEETAEGVAVLPDRDLVLGMASPARAAIYHVLARFKENVRQTQPFSFRPEHLEERLEGSGLSSETLAGFRRLLYPQGHSLVLADAAAYMATLKDPAEKKRFYRTVARRTMLLVKLEVTASSDIDQLVRYWDWDGSHKELRPLLESLARVPGGCNIDVAHLLPSFARKRIYTFPAPAAGDPLASRRDCHWSALNFFNETPNDAFCDPQTVKRALDAEYDKVEGEPRMGDVVVIFQAGGDTIHSAVYVADDMVFTKNGAASTQPWAYMRLDDMIAYYAACCPPDNPPETVVLRRKAGAGR